MFDQASMFERALIAAAQGGVKIIFLFIILVVPFLLLTKFLLNDAAKLFRKAIAEGKSTKQYPKGPFSHKPNLMMGGIETVFLQTPSSLFSEEELDAIAAVAPELVERYRPFVGRTHRDVVVTINENAERKSIEDEEAKAERDLVAMGQKVDKKR